MGDFALDLMAGLAARSFTALGALAAQAAPAAQLMAAAVAALDTHGVAELGFWGKVLTAQAAPQTVQTAPLVPAALV